MKSTLLLMTSVKIALAGPYNAGKTSIIERYFRDSFYSDKPPTRIPADASKVLSVKNVSVKLMVSDSVGQERFHSVISSLYRSSDVVFVVFDIADADSLQKAKQNISEIQSICEENILIYLVGNKRDLQAIRVVNPLDIERYSTVAHIPYIEISAKTGFNVDLLFENAIQAFLDKRKEIICEMPALYELTLNSSDSYTSPRCC